MTDPILHAASKGHTHGGSDVPLQTRSERLRSVNPSDHTQIDGRDEQWRYLDSNRLGGLDTGVLNNVSTGLQLVAPAEFKAEVVDASDPSFGTAGLPEDLPTANAWAGERARIFEHQRCLSIERRPPNRAEQNSLTRNRGHRPHRHRQPRRDT